MTKTNSSEKPSKEKFVKEYILTGCLNGTKAAINAGYSEKTAAQAASRLLKDVKILAMIDEHKKVETKKFIRTKEEKLLNLEKIIDESMKINDEKGMFNPAAAIAAIKTHNEMQGDNAPIETNQKVQVTNTLKSRLTAGSRR